MSWSACTSCRLERIHIRLHIRLRSLSTFWISTFSSLLHIERLLPLTLIMGTNATMRRFSDLGPYCEVQITKSPTIGKVPLLFS